MSVACGDLGDVRPAADIALPVVVPSHGDHGAVVFNPHRVIVACADLANVRPAANIAPPIVVVSHGDHGAVVFNPHRVIFACREPDDVRPSADIALPVAVVSHGDHGAVVLKPHRVELACGDHGVDCKVGRYGIVVVHGDGSCGGVDIGDGVHIASPIHKAVVGIWSRHQVDHLTFIAGRSPFSRGRCRATIGTGNSEVVLWSGSGCGLTAHHPRN